MSLDAANAEASVVAARWDRNSPGRRTSILVVHASRLDPSLLQGHDRSKVLAAGAAAGTITALLLLICGSNVASLMLARGAARQSEFALRAALGAGRRRVAQQLAAEVLLIALASAGAGVMVSVLTLRVAAIWLPLESLVGSLSPDLRVLMFALGGAFGVALFFGLAPLRQALRVDSVAGLKGDHGRLPAMRLRRWLVAGQVAVSVVLLVVAALLGRSIAHAYHLDPGYSTAGLYIVRVDRASVPDGSPEGLARFVVRVRDELAAEPGILAVGRTMIGPFSGAGVTQATADNAHDPVVVHFSHVDDRYFRTLGVPLLMGRFPNASDAGEILVNERLARRFWGTDAAALDRVLHAPGNPGSPRRSLHVVGVVPTLQTTDVGQPDAPTYYAPVRDSAASLTSDQSTLKNGAVESLLVRGAPTAPVVRLAEDTVRALSPGTLVSVVSVDDRIAAETGPARIGAAIAGFVGILGLLVGAVGIHGLVAHAVIARTREIGIHVALGAPRGRLLRIVVGSTLRSVLVGAAAACGLVAVCALSFSSQFEGALFGMSPLDPVAFLAAAAILVAVVLVAAYVPARRALRLNPTDALRHGA
jgi:predicted permease